MLPLDALCTEANDTITVTYELPPWGNKVLSYIFAGLLTVKTDKIKLNPNMSDSVQAEIFSLGTKYL